MGRSQELNELKRGTVIGCHLCNKSIRDISLLLNIPRSTDSGIITKWKQLGSTATQPRSERGQRMLKCNSAAISTTTVHRELHRMGFHG
ncbi:unnamed protein product [Staurois parvus]|uniref:Transposase Tc1-like domain-containing protein n=1 Tax=Staurois parvus TaxID=386267 RepID=A0ABN9AF82_9NEOB|nr:unnamed protein product [Staurois parvus]